MTSYFIQSNFYKKTANVFSLENLLYGIIITHACMGKMNQQHIQLPTHMSLKGDPNA